MKYLMPMSTFIASDFTYTFEYEENGSMESISLTNEGSGITIEWSVEYDATSNIYTMTASGNVLVFNLDDDNGIENFIVGPSSFAAVPLPGTTGPFKDVKIDPAIIITPTVIESIIHNFSGSRLWSRYDKQHN